MDLTTLKRVDLQKLAKKHGIKANQKSEKLIKALSEIVSSSTTDNVARLSPQETISPTKPKRGRGKKSKSSDEASSNESGVSQSDVSDPKADNQLTDGSNYDNSIMSEITPDWNDLDLNNLMDLSVESSAPSATRQIKSQGIKRPSRSSSRSCKGTPIISNNTDQSIKKPQDSTPKSSESSTKEAGKTFSIPKNRTKAKIENKENSTTGRRTAKKRHSQEQEAAVQTKKTRASDKWKKDMKDAVLTAVEQKLGRPSQLRQNSTTSTPLFSAKGVTVAKSSSTKGIFTKAHKKGFGKLESIDDYQRRKEERAEMLLGSGRKRDVLSRLAKPKTPTAKINRPSILTPVNNRKASQNRKSSASAFKPSVTSTSRINTNFGGSKSKLVTPKKVTVSFAKSPSKLPKPKFQTPVDSRRKRQSRASLTPFKPAAVNTPSSTKKNFDLQESLKKPLSWVPHKGPLKKFEDTTKVSLQQRFKNARNPKSSNREKRRQDREAARNNAKSSQMMRRRGIKQ